MMRLRQIVLYLILAMILPVVGFTGVVSPELEDILSESTHDALIPVWIYLPSSLDGKNMSKNMAANFSKRADRYRESIQLFKANHISAQESLLKYLNNANQKSERKVKSHWLVNLIEAELTKREIFEIAARSDVEIIYLEPKIVSIMPEDAIKAVPSEATSVEFNLTYINAHTAWAAGYTGAGSVVCSFDTGVDGDHPALENNWKGQDGDSLASWFDPAKNQLAPHHIPDCGYTGCNTNHGTHTMGIMVGHDDIGGDTVGVAPGAQWISAAVIDVAGTSIVDAFEWAADPDRNPNTLDDVPDVINHSWGVIGIDCQNLFYDLIDNSEVLGIVNIFSAGNEGSSVSTIRNPADRALDSLDCFAVGNINQTNSTIYSSSSRGPSLCPIGEIKPNISAPGVSIRSTIPNDNYGSMSGTSMAAPHVSGLVALLRQKNPNATVDEIKTAILVSADDMGQSVPNNDIGWGRIDCMEALNALSGTNTDPNVKVYAFDHAPVSPGDTVDGSLLLTNLGQTVTSVSATITGSNDALTVLSGTTSFGTIAEGDTVRAGTDLRVAVDDTVTVGSILSIDLTINGTGYTNTVKLFFLVEPLPNRSFVTHNVGNIGFSLSNFGTFGLGPNDPSSFFPNGGVGFTYAGGGNDLFEGGLMIGRSFNNVSDGVRNLGGEPDGDFAVLPGGDILFVTPKAGVSQQSHSRFSDDRATNPNGITIEQNSFAFDYAPYTDLLILQYIITNTSGGSLSNMYVGLYMDWDVVAYSSNGGGYEFADVFSWIAYRNGVEYQDYRGVKVLDPLTLTSYTENGTVAFFPPCGDGFTENEKIAALSDGTNSANTYKMASVDLLQVTSALISLSAGQTDTVSFALIAGAAFADIQETAIQASAAYQGIVTDVEEPGTPDELPEVYSLEQNYPNPFNPMTTISFSLPKKSDYIFEIFNIAGQRVYQEHKIANAGVHKIVWDASEYSSGLYFYRITTDSFVDSKKMILLK